jgi:type I restriction enzyme, S subunit
VLITCIASIGKNAILKSEGGCNQQINAVIPNQNNNAEFLYYLFEAAKQYLLANAGITATMIISKATFSELKFRIPLRQEQTAIAAVLTDMDAELVALEQRREKTRALKQAMMQELLIGKTRLVSPELSHA